MAEAYNLKLSNKYRKKLERLAELDDPEQAHSDADNLLCDLLGDLGYHYVVEAYHEIWKQYGWK